MHTCDLSNVCQCMHKVSYSMYVHTYAIWDTDVIVFLLQIIKMKMRRRIRSENDLTNTKHIASHLSTQLK